MTAVLCYASAGPSPAFPLEVCHPVTLIRDIPCLPVAKLITLRNSHTRQPSTKHEQGGTPMQGPLQKIFGQRTGSIV